MRAAAERRFTVPARTGAYGLVQRRRSGTRPPWSQGRLWCCPAENDTRRRTPAAYRFSSHGFYGRNRPRRPRLRGFWTTEKPGMKKANRAGPRRRAALSRLPGHRRPCDHGGLVLLRRRKTSPYVPVRAGPFHPGPIRGPRYVSASHGHPGNPGSPRYVSTSRGHHHSPGPTHVLAVDVRPVGSAGRTASSRGAGPSGEQRVSRREGHSPGQCGRRGRVQGPARTGTYALVQRRRSGTRLPWSQGRLCPIRQDSAARRRGPAATRSFHPGFFRGQQPSELRPPRVVPPIKPMRGKNDTRLGHNGECRSQRDTTTDALATSEVSSYFADAGRVRMFPCVPGL
jgi:hypothetical protein